LPDDDDDIGGSPSGGPPSFMDSPPAAANPQPLASAIQGSIQQGQVTQPGDAPPPPPAGVPAQRPTFFRGVIKALGLALTGVQAGLTAPRNAQGPAIAAQTAANAPQAKFEQTMANKKAMTSQQLDDLNVAMTQLKLHQMHMIASKMEDDQQDAVYNMGRDTLTSLSEKGKVDILSTGDYDAITQEFGRKQADAKAAGQGLLPLQVLPAPGSSAGKPQYALVMVGKDRLTDDWKETWGAKDLGYSDDDFKAAGLSSFKFTAPSGMDQQKALQLRASQYLNWATKSEQGMAAWKKNAANNQVKTSEGQKNRDMRMSIAELNNSTRRATAQIKGLSDSADKEIISAGKTLIQANKALGAAQGKLANKAWTDLGGGESREIATLRRARDQAETNYTALQQKKDAAKAISDQRVSPKVPKGTVATKEIVLSYLQKAGGNKDKARANLTNDGYAIPKAGQ